MRGIFPLKRCTPSCLAKIEVVGGYLIKGTLLYGEGGGENDVVQDLKGGWTLCSIATLGPMKSACRGGMNENRYFDIKS